MSVDDNWGSRGVVLLGGRGYETVGCWRGYVTVGRCTGGRGVSIVVAPFLKSWLEELLGVDDVDENSVLPFSSLEWEDDDNIDARRRR